MLADGAAGGKGEGGEGIESRLQVGASACGGGGGECAYLLEEVFIHSFDGRESSRESECLEVDNVGAKNGRGAVRGI